MNEAQELLSKQFDCINFAYQQIDRTSSLEELAVNHARENNIPLTINEARDLFNTTPRQLNNKLQTTKVDKMSINRPQAHSVY